MFVFLCFVSRGVFSFDRSLRFSLKFGSFRLPAPSTASQLTLLLPHGCRHTCCSLTRKGGPLRRHFLLKTKPFSMFPFLFHQSFKATSFPVTWSLPSIPVPVPQTLGAVASSIEKNLSCKSCKRLSFHMFSATILICNMSKPA